MKKIVLWKVKENNGQELDVEEIQSVQETKTENQLEEVITRCPDLLMEDLKLIGRQTETPGGPLDLLGVDSDGNLVVFELKRGTLTREAVAQIVDYSSHLATLEPKELSEHISSRSGISSHGTRRNLGKPSRNSKDQGWFWLVWVPMIELRGWFPFLLKVNWIFL